MTITAIMRAPKIREVDLHGFAADLIKRCGVPNLIAFHPANEGQRSPRNGAFLKRHMLMVPGVSDLIVIIAGRAHALELKSTDGVLSPAQKAFRALCMSNGTPYSIARSTDDVMRILKEWGAIRA